MTLYAVDYAGSISTLRMFPREEYIDIGTYDRIYQYPLTAQHLKIVEDTLYFTVGSHNGNAYVYSGGPIYSMKRDGSDCRMEQSGSEDQRYRVCRRQTLFHGYGDSL